ncbi:heparan-alpha-glucosaminide N-acetyltransferase domain-containing protein [Luteimonas sp. S4-F44]|uniref:DUF1624 domain-containing protein n=1 Tax=Luteimonas sp. S4-F44 TaxID=2925842 RepID=UPI001F539F27|nr:heparan-alpha-glucosaminide N-acetyltransferase domain-containing protein [Luteimonas sp. S4-F44]UNK42065.1 heparan-alpha-glucosaminide N-acetyltransferase domain-containing protein [Luteimonas sp. S4-F44]
MAVSVPSPQPRLVQIDLLRGLVMLLMLLDHVRETFFLHAQMGDPVDIDQVSPLLFGFRLLAHLCAPVFVFLTGLSAWLYGQRQPAPRAATAAFLFQRGLFLVLLEVTLVNFAWTFEFPPQTLYLQVIWAIGLSMLALSALLWLPRPALVTLGLVVVAAHNLLDSVRVDSAWSGVWAVLHQRAWLEPIEGLRVRTSYPVLPWIGVIALGYAAGPWFAAGFGAMRRQRRLLAWGVGALAAFAVLRLVNGYGDAPWRLGEDGLRTAMSLVNVTKYPPSLLFLCLTLGVGLLLLRLFERPAWALRLAPVATYGAAPMFFYLLHLYVLKLLYLAAVAVWGHNQGAFFGFGAPAWLLPAAAALALALYPAVRWFAALKARHRDWAWLRYF